MKRRYLVTLEVFADSDLDEDIVEQEIRKNSPSVDSLQVGLFRTERKTQEGRLILKSGKATKVEKA